MTNKAKSQQAVPAPDLNLVTLRRAIQDEYTVVAEEPDHGFHFHIGRPLARLLGCEEAWLEGIPEAAVASFAGAGNPFSLGALNPGDRVVDMTPAMLAKARQAGLEHVSFR